MNYPDDLPPHQYSSSEQQVYNSDWILYYSEEGYPYYYNERTGESQWADYDQSQSQDPGEHTVSSAPEYTYSDDSEEPEVSGESANSLSDSEEEAQFQEYLQSDEGRAALQAEKNMVERYAMKRSAIATSPVHDLDNDTGTHVDDEFNEDSQRKFLSQSLRTEYNGAERDRHFPQRSPGAPRLSQGEVSEFVSTYGLPPPPSLSGHLILPPSPASGKGRGVRFSAENKEDVEGGGPYRRHGGTSSDDESVSSDDEDVQLIKEPIVPLWLTNGTWSVATALDRSIRTPALASICSLVGLRTTGTTPATAASPWSVSGFLVAIGTHVYGLVAYTAEYLVDGSVSKAGMEEAQESLPP